MHTLGDLIHRPEPLTPSSPCATALARFMAEPALVALAVVEAGRPVGVVSRPAFLARMETAGAADRPVAELMNASPAIAAASERPRDLSRRLMEHSPGDLLGGFVVVDGAGGYLGVASALDLFAARLGRSAPGAAAVRLAARFGEAVRKPVIEAIEAAGRLGALELPRGADGELAAITQAGGEVLALLDAATELRDARHAGPALSPHTHRLEDLMDEIEARWRGPAERRGLTFMVSYDGEPDCRVEADRPRLNQVFDALITHALAHAGHGVVEASLKATLEEAGVVLHCKVRDSGARHDRAYLAAMFDPTARGGDIDGLGVRLGLALASRIVAAMGGELNARANPGLGATRAFEITLPRARPANSEDAGARPPAQRIAHVLVVEDNATNRMVIETLCEMLGCTSESVVDGVEAVEAAAAGRFDIILMDIKMPRMDGLTATAEIRKLPGHAGATPIIALTANADPDDVRRYLAAGMRCVVEKPIKADRFAEAINQALAGEADDVGEAAAA